MSINGIKVDMSRGFDIMRGHEVLRHCTSYEEARALVAGAGVRHIYIRYWAVKGG